jgi:hypothetical protein
MSNHPKWWNEWKHDEPGEGEFYAIRFLRAAGYLFLKDLNVFNHPDPDHERTVKEVSALSYLADAHGYAWTEGI